MSKGDTVLYWKSEALRLRASNAELRQALMAIADQAPFHIGPTGHETFHVSMEVARAALAKVPA